MMIDSFRFEPKERKKVNWYHFKLVIENAGSGVDGSLGWIRLVGLELAAGTTHVRAGNDNRRSASVVANWQVKPARQSQEKDAFRIDRNLHLQHDRTS